MYVPHPTPPEHERSCDLYHSIRILYMPAVYAIISFFSYRFFRSYTYYDLIECGAYMVFDTRSIWPTLFDFQHMRRVHCESLTLKRARHFLLHTKGSDADTILYSPSPSVPSCEPKRLPAALSPRLMRPYLVSSSSSMSPRQQRGTTSIMQFSAKISQLYLCQ